MRLAQTDTDHPAPAHLARACVAFEPALSANVNCSHSLCNGSTRLPGDRVPGVALAQPGTSLFDAPSPSQVGVLLVRNVHHRWLGASRVAPGANRRHSAGPGGLRGRTVCHACSFRRASAGWDTARARRTASPPLNQFSSTHTLLFWG